MKYLKRVVPLICILQSLTPAAFSQEITDPSDTEALRERFVAYHTKINGEKNPGAIPYAIKIEHAIRKIVGTEDLIANIPANEKLNLVRHVSSAKSHQESMSRSSMNGFCRKINSTPIDEIDMADIAKKLENMEKDEKVIIRNRLRKLMDSISEDSQFYIESYADENIVSRIRTSKTDYSGLFEEFPQTFARLISDKCSGRDITEEIQNTNDEHSNNESNDSGMLSVD